ncbi:MAG: iron-containing alcohol dehydrogenase [Peptostreptococcaceae bacterium]|nr:iron-containing alcohol dehydrogenase [Peptostreptococcaceae bacterium]
MWEKDINIEEIREIRVKTTVFFGIGAIKKIDSICSQLSKRGIHKIIAVTGKGAYKKTGAWDHVLEAFAKHGIDYVHYDGITPNPEADPIDEAVKIAKDFGAQAVLGIGGGSSIDAAKAVSALLAYPEHDARSISEGVAIRKALPILAINLTHGTGSEVDRFSVLTIPETNHKLSLTADCLYPLYSINDPQLMTGLGAEQTAYVSVDAVNHVLEACSTKLASPFSILLAKEVVRLVAEYLPKALKDPMDLPARYYLSYASMMAGTAFDNGLLHITHALEHPLSGLKTETIHGQGLALLLPAVLKRVFEARKHTIFEVLQPILGELDFETATGEMVAAATRNWLHSVGIKESLRDLGFGEEHLDKLTELVYETPGLKGLLGLAPIEVTPELVRTIFAESL